MVASITEPKSHIENGIVFYDTPWTVDASEYLNLHGEHDFIASRGDDTYTVYCYVEGYDYNKSFEDLYYSKYKSMGCSWIGGLSNIDGGFLL